MQKKNKKKKMKFGIDIKQCMLNYLWNVSFLLAASKKKKKLIVACIWVFVSYYDDRCDCTLHFDSCLYDNVGLSLEV